MIHALRLIEPIGICIAGFMGVSMVSYAIRLAILHWVTKKGTR